MEENKKTCLYDNHVALGARMSPFGGFIMPIEYSGIVEEHNAVRTACGVFDVSHMGEVCVTGPDAERFVNHIFTNDVSGAAAGRCFYGMVLHPDGGTVDDLLVYKRGDNDFFLVINASNISKDLDWINRKTAGFDVAVENMSDALGEIAVQGPASEQVMTEVLGLDCASLDFYTFKTISVDDENVIVSRTGYTGEDGFEIYASHGLICMMWDKLMDSGKVKPCGLGCRDTLRFEVGLPLYGDELADDISPVEAGLGIFVKLDKPEFIGKEAVEALKRDGVTRKLVGIEVLDRAIPRHGYEVLDENDNVVGAVTTGYHAVSVDKSLAMALVKSEYAALGTSLKVRIRRKTFPAVVVKKKFYRKNYKN